MGVQFETNTLAAKQRTFVEENKIEAVLINEAVTSVDVYYYLCCLIKNEEEMVIGFPAFKPGLRFLAQVYKEAKLFFPFKAKISGQA